MVSIILALYNGEEYVVAQLESIINQTYSDIELIILDDCSSDNGVQTVRRFLERSSFKNYRIYLNDCNLGVNATFQKGVKYSNGTYIIFSDQDDIWMPNKIEILLKLLIKNNKKIAGCSSLLMKNNTKTDKLYIDLLKVTPFNGMMNNKLRGASILANREYIEGLLPFSKFDLYDKWIYFHARMNNNIVLFERPLDYYRVHSNNVVGTMPRFSVKEKVKIKMQKRIFFYKELKKSVNTKLGSGFNEPIDKIMDFYERISNVLDGNCRILNTCLVLKALLFEKFSFRERISFISYLIR